MWDLAWRLGVHKFILGQTGAGLAMLLTTVLRAIRRWIMGPIGIIEGLSTSANPIKISIRCTSCSGRRGF